MKILIINTQGRSGTTLLQSIISHVHSLRNLGEYIDYSDEQSYIRTTRYLLRNDSWCCKMFFDTDFGDFYHPIEFINELRPNMVINSYREDLFDQYLSLQISIHNNLWNSTNKFQYDQFTIADPENSIRTFLKNISLYNKQLGNIDDQIPLIDISYEQVISNRVVVYTPINILQISNNIENLPIKQNSKNDKFSLIENINEIKKQWEIILHNDKSQNASMEQ